MIIFDFSELEEQAEKIAAAHNVDKVYATADGNFFLPKDKSAADDHNAKEVRKVAEAAEVFVFDFTPAEETEEITDADEKSVEACKLLVQTVSADYVDNIDGLKADLKKEGFSDAVIAQVLNETSTHPE